MTPMLLFWFALSILTDVAGQLAFKIGANRAVAANIGSVDGSVWAAQLLDRWTLIGVAIYAVEVVVWLRILSIAPLSLAYPLASLNFIGVVIASRIVLKEPVGMRRIAGASLITFGVALVASSA